MLVSPNRASMKFFGRARKSGAEHFRSLSESYVPYVANYRMCHGALTYPQLNLHCDKVSIQRTSLVQRFNARITHPSYERLPSALGSSRLAVSGVTHCGVQFAAVSKTGGRGDGAAAGATWWLPALVYDRARNVS